MGAQALLCLLLLPAIAANPFNWGDRYRSRNSVRFQTQCSSHCTGSSNFQYQIGKTYHYKYDVSSLSNIFGASENNARFEANADVYIHVLSKCELALTLSDVSVKSSQPGNADLTDVTTYAYKSALENHVLRFSFQDGRVDEICENDDEEPFAINFKRGILSAFQNSMSQHNRPENLNEIDVTGNCPTAYSISQRGTRSMQISKTKDLLGCSDRHHYRTSLQSIPFHAPQAIKSLPLLKGIHKCTQTISKTKGHVTRSLCLESLVFRPFSRQEAGARTETTQKLEHIQTVDQHDIQKDGVFRRSSLIFDHTKTKDEMEQLLWTTKEKLSDLCRAAVEDISAEVPALFADLVYLMRGLDSRDIMDIWERVDRGTICGNNHERALKFILDSLPMVGTSATVEVMTEMLLAKRVTGPEAELWMTSFTFIQHPDKDMIRQLKRLLLSETHRKYSLLPITSLVNNFCFSQQDCQSITEVTDIVDILEDILGINCQDADQDLLLITLRGINNIGHADQLTPVLDKCMTLTSNNMNTRVMAVQAYKGVTCNTKRNALNDLFMNKDEDSELRIAAYLSLMKCPSAGLLQQVKTTLETEPVNQVGSFVWTHLTNLMETSDPHKQALKEILEDEQLKKEFDLDKRKYSRNYEWSYFSDKFGTGAMAESNLIWSSSSFLPRSLMMNLTIDFLGHSVNLLEVGVRTQGLEKLVMNYFGPGGVFEKKGKSDNFNNPTRCVKKTKMNDMKKKHGASEDEISASYYLRIFGNDLDFKHFNEKDIMEVKKKLNAKDILASLAKGDKISFSHSAMFLDSTVSVPTVGGMALELSINGTSSVELKATGKMNLRNLSMKKMEMNFDVRPSGAVHLSGVMLLNAGIAKTGLRIVTTLHSSTGVSGNVDLVNGQVFSASLDTPKEKLEVLDVKSEFFILHDKAEEKQKMMGDVIHAETKCTSQAQLKATGYKMCVETSFTAASTDENSPPHFPFTGPSSFSCVIYKEDAPRGFKLSGKYIKSEHSFTGHASFSTPGSSVDRNVAAGYFIDTKAKSLEMELTSPWKKLLIKGAYVVNDNTRSMLATFMNDGREYALEIKTDKRLETGKTVWTPTIRLLRPADSSLVKFVPKLPEKFTLDGSVTIHDDLEEFTADIQISSGVKPDPIKLQANIMNKKTQKTVSGSVTLGKKKTYAATFQSLMVYSGKKKIPSKIQPTVLITKPGSRLFILNGNIDYKDKKMVKSDLTVNMEDHLKSPIKLTFKATRSNKKTLVYRGNGKLTSQFVVMKSRGVVTIPNEGLKKKSSPLLSSKIVTSYVLPTVKNKALKKNTVVLNMKLNDRSLPSIKKYYASINCESKKYQDASFVTTLDIAHKATFTKLQLSFKHNPKAKNLKDKNRELKVGATISHKISDKKADIRYDLHTIYPIKKIDYHWKGKHEHTVGKLFSFETYNMIVLSKEKTFELRLKGDDKSKKLLEAYGNMELNYPSFTIGKQFVEGQSYKLTTIIQQNPQKEYIHTVNVRDKNGLKHVMVTTFSKSKNNNFNLNSQVDINGEHRSKLIVKAMKENSKADSTFSFEKDNKIYKAQISSDGFDKKFWNVDLDVLYPERRILSYVEGGLKNGRIILNTRCSWDADKDITKKVQADMAYVHDISKNGQLFDIEYTLKVETPFRNHTIYQWERIMKSDGKHIMDAYKIINGKLENEWSYKYSFNHPMTVERLEMLFQLKTPFECLRRFHSEIQHKYDGSKYLSSLVKGAYNEHEMAVTLKVANRGDLVKNHYESSLEITSSVPQCKTLTLEFNHNDDGREYTSNFVYERNGKKYTADLKATYMKVELMVNLFSSLEIVLPDGRFITIVFNHDNTLTNMDSSITGKWWNNNQAKLVLASKFSKAEKNYIVDITFTSSFEKVKSLILKSHYNDMDGQEGSVFFELNNDPSTTSNHKYKYTDTELTYEGSNAYATYSGVIKYERYPYTVLLKHTQKLPERGEYVLDASVDKNRHGWRSDVRLLTPFEEVRNIDVKSLLKEIDNVWILDSKISLDVKKSIQIDFNVDTDKWTKLNCEIKTPYEEMTHLKLGFNRKPEKDTYSSDVFIEVQPYFNMAKMNYSLSRNARANFQTGFSVDIPDLDFKHIKIIVNNVEQRRGVKTNINVKYHPDKEIDLKFRARYNENNFPEKTKIFLDFSSPYEMLQSLNLRSDIDKTNENWIANLNLKTSNKEFQSFNTHYELFHSDTVVRSNLEIKCPSHLDDPVYCGIDLDWGETAGMNFSLVAPTIGRTSIGFKRKSNSWLDFQNKIFGSYGGKELDMDIGLKHDEMTTKAWLTHLFPGGEESFIKSHVHREGNSYNDFDVGGFLQIGEGSPEYNTSLQFAATEVKSSIGLTFITPHTMPFSYLTKSSINGPQREATGYLMVGKDYLFDSYERALATETLLDYEYKLNYLFDGKGHNVDNMLFIEWTELGEELKFNHHYDEKHIQLEGIHKNAKANGDDKETLDINLFTPYEHVNDVGLHAFLHKKETTYNGKCTIEYMDDKEAELTFDMTQKSPNKLNVDATLNIPETDYKSNVLKYTQVTRKDQIIADARVKLGNGDKMKGRVEFKNNEEFIITVTGPIDKFEKLTITGKYNEKQQRVNGDVQLKLDLHPKPANLEFDIYINDEPATLNFKLRTPYENVKKADLTITHTGKDWKKFKTQSQLTSEAIGKVNSEIFFNFISETEMACTATLTSSVEKMENLKFGFNTKKQQDNQLSHLEVGWDVDKEIIIDNSWALNRDKSNTDFKTDFEITTPFNEVKSVIVKFTHNNGKKKINQYINIAHNGRTYFDSTFKYKIGQRHLGSIDIQYPRPMAFELEAETGDETFDGKLKINWDKNSPESLFEFVTKLSDKSKGDNMDKAFSFKVMHPVRHMGVDCQIRSADKEVFSSGHVTWDERKGKTFSYDIGYSDRSTEYSQMYDGHVKLGVPQRSIKVEGSHRDTGSTKTLSSSIYWDADKDDAKKVVLISTTEQQDRMERISLNLNLPYINKQMNMGISRKKGYGSSILESEAEISYSSDPSKNIIITTKIDNTEMDLTNVGNFNYTLDVGFVHKITGIDIRWESHFGQVDKVSSTGSRITYVTADDDKKIMAFWSQLDSDRNKGEIMIMTPLKTVTIVGDIDNGKRLQNLKFYTLEDGHEALKLEVAVDPNRRNMDIEVHYDRANANKMLSITGNLISDSALQINFNSQDGHTTVSESQIAVTLNSSDILHTRVLWRPSVFKEIQTFMSTEAAVLSLTASEAFTQTLNAVGAEVKNKYARVSQELRDETKQVFELMEKEMDGLSTQLESLRTAYRRFYQNNNLGIRKMGEAISEGFSGLSDVIQDVVKQYRAYYTGITKATNKWFIDLRTYPIMQKYLQASSEFIEGLRKSRLVIEETMEKLLEQLSELSEVTYKMYSGVKRQIDRKLNSYNRMAHELPVYKQMMAQRNLMEDAMKMPNWLEGYERMYLSFQEMLQDQYDDLMSRREFREMYAVGAEVHKQFMYFNLEKNLESAFKRVVSLSKNLILMELVKMKDTIINMEKSRLIVYDPERGELQFEIHLPVELKSLAEPPKFKLEALEPLRLWVMSKAKPTNNTIWDTYYEYVSYLKPSEWLPPFEATGYVIGSQHILTFDKTHYDFMSTCSHVLARDMLHDTFSVVLNYNRNQRQRKVKSVCLHFEDSQSMEISNNYELTVNNRETEMPYYSNIVSVIREGDLITVKYNGGLMVVCNPTLDLYKVTLSGWYHGRTAGLLGVYDNEKTGAQSILNMVNDFEVNRRTCRSSNNLAVSHNPGNDKDNICAQLFRDESSKFRPCFKQVDPSSFLEMCQRYMADMPSDVAVHKVTEQYRFVCRDQGVFMGTLEEFVPCNKKEPFKVFGEDTSYHSADVLFLVQDNKCNQHTISSLGSIVTEINKVLNTADMKSNRFGLLGIEGMNPTARTMNGNYFGQASHFLKAIETLKFPDQTSPINLGAALKMAMTYPFRAGVAKTLVIIPCDVCEIGFMESSLAYVLKNTGFRVHILKENGQIVMNSKTSNEIPLIDMANYDHSPDYCETLVHTTKGSIFDTSKLNQGNGRSQRKFIQELAEKVGWDTKLPKCQLCQCNAETGMTECHLCEASSVLTYIPLKAPSLPHVFGKLSDLKHKVLSYVTK